MLESARSKVRNGRAASLLSVAVLAWLGIIAVPCTLLASVAAVETSSEVEESQGDCHGGHPSAATASDECCCEILGVASGEAAKTQKVSAVVVIASSSLRSDFHSVLATGKVEMQHGPPTSELSPPVYLSTQRLRI